MKKQDDIRNLLGRIRTLQTENTKIGLTSFEDVKKVLDTKEKKRINESSTKMLLK